ncbi:type IV secretion system DNA-binding domain-containing protein [Patescibacteria group bacterium]|nr:type IV secretion system DNA-binding domain-containing protein [Patescibacteria group bacterium]MBU1703216.1 type IV secretion system DNA-binding domain-containing protein [Patescibacteria group bacterium]MBU1953753.1 type IV secretion system DNA-binding domain-containing protein [Patescibacteria group bacterium]
MEFLHVIVPQGTPDNPKKENLFLHFLNNLHNTAKGKIFSLEMFGYKQYTYFFVGCNAEDVKLIEGLIYSIYPECEIKPQKDYTTYLNAQTHVIKGTSLHMERSDIYPIQTFETFDVDSLSGIFSVISKMNPNDRAWIQILTSPRTDNWIYHFKRTWRMKINKIKRIFRLKDYVRLKGKKTFHKEEDTSFVTKTESNPFEIQIKIGAVSGNAAEAERNVQALAKAFYQFNKTDANGFVMERIRGGENFLNEYRRRKINRPAIVGANELATLYHYPNPDHVPHVVHVLAKRHEPPKNLPTQGEGISMFGITNYHNTFQQFGIQREDRRRHLYVVGKSGTGKSKLLELLIQNDINEGHGIAVLDPHGDLVDNIIRMIPEHRIKDVILFDPGDTEFPIAFNPLEKVDEKFKMQITIGFIDIFKKLFGDNWSDRLEHVLRYTTLALLDSPNTSVLSILKMLTDKNYRQTIVARIQDSVVKNFWVNEFAGWSEKFDAEAITPLLNKVGQLVSTNMIRNMIGQPKNSFDIRDVMDNQKILLMKVSKGLLGEENSQLIGSMIITKIYQAAMARADIKEEQRKDFYFYVDEFQNFATDTFSEILSEARKYHLCMTIAHQYVGQLGDVIKKTVFGNVGSIINFRVGAEDAVVLAEEYTPVFSVRDIINLGVREFYLKMSIGGELSEAFSGRTMDMTLPDYDHSAEIFEQSREKYCTPKDKVEEMLKKWDEGSAEPPPKDINQVIKQAEEFETPLI